MEKISGVVLGGGGSRSAIFRLAWHDNSGGGAASAHMLQWLRTVLPPVGSGVGVGAGAAASGPEFLFRASRVQTVAEAARRSNLARIDVVQMIDQLGRQIAYFRKHFAHGWVGMREHEVLQICCDDGDVHSAAVKTAYVLANIDLLFPVDEKKSDDDGDGDNDEAVETAFCCRIDDLLPSAASVDFPGFCFRQVDELPFWAPFGAVYFSLGTFIEGVLLGEGTGTERKKEDKEIVRNKWPKMYWFLQRCLHKDPDKRKWFYV